MKLKAAKCLAEYALELWVKEKKRCEIPVSHDNGGNGTKALRDILQPYIGDMPDEYDPRRTYWTSVKYDIIQLAYEDYLKAQQLWVKSLPEYGIHIRDKPEIRESTRTVNNLRRMVNHALELDMEAKIVDFLPVAVKEQYRLQRDLVIKTFMAAKEFIESHPEIAFDPDIIELISKLKVKVLKYLSDEDEEDIDE